MKLPDEFKIPSPQFPEEDKVIETVLRLQAPSIPETREHSEPRHYIPENVVKGMANIATNAWKAKGKMLDAASGQVRDEMRRVYRHIESILEALHGMGMEVKDHTGDAFDYGLPLNVITVQPVGGITRETVIETIKPTVFWQQQIIQMGEVVIATPTSTEAKA